jgi:hypothetical protein
MMIKVSMLSTADLTERTGVGGDRLAQLEASGVNKRSARDQWPALDTLSALVRYYRSDTRRAAKSEAEAAFRDAKMAEVRQRMAERARELIRTDDAMEAMEVTLARVIIGLLSLSARIGVPIWPCGRESTVRFMNFERRRPTGLPSRCERCARRNMQR